VKDARRQEAKERKQNSAGQAPTGGDRDLEGIVAGPQPLAEWQVEGLATFEEADDEAAEEPGPNG
jgi:hypothetical protein